MGLRLLVPSETLAFPAGQGKLRQQYIARRKLIFIFEESVTFCSGQLDQRTVPEQQSFSLVFMKLTHTKQNLSAGRFPFNFLTLP
jgi:hypothetical protein